MTMEAGKWYQVGTPFVELSEGETPQLNTVFAKGFSDGDSINIFDSTTSIYTPYYWKTSAGGWCTKRGTSPVAIDVPRGQAVFINKQVTGIVTLAGRVSVAEATTFGREEGDTWNQIVCVYPQALKLNDIKWTGITDGDAVSIYDSQTAVYAPYYWKSSAGGWCTKRVSTPVNVEIPIGQAMFINKVSKGLGTCSAR